MADPEEDPWNTPDVHKNHNHPAIPSSNGNGPVRPDLNGNDYGSLDTPDLIHGRTTSTFTTTTIGSGTGSGRQSAASGTVPSNAAASWNYYDGSNPIPDPDFGDPSSNTPTSPFGGGPGGPGGSREPGANPPSGTHSRIISAGRTGSAVEENILVTLLPEKEGMFMFQHHNYEVSSNRRGSKVIRRYSDFVWLLDCLHKRYPFRVLPLLPPKRVAVNGNHLSNDGGFIEKRRRGLARFLNAVVRHPVLGQEQLVVMFLTVPTVSLFVS
jgi:sorting nexin-8